MLAGCIPAGQNTVRRSDDAPPSYANSFTIDQQKAPPGNIKSIQLYPGQSPSSPPVYQLNSGQKLVLSFDYLDEQNKQFRLEISHRSANWEKSSLSPSQFLKGFNYAYLQTDGQSFSRRPTYQHLEYEFPNDEIQFSVSGNYLLEIYDSDSGNILFTYPFFVTENKGTLETQIEQLFAQRRDGRSLDQPFSTYRYPTFVELPQFELSFYYSQNQYWGRMKETRSFDTSTPAEIAFHLPRDDAFIADYDFKLLDLRTLDPDGEKILEHRPETTPPQIILRRDILFPESNPSLLAENNFGKPLDNRHSEYADVHFSLEIPDNLNPDADIYIVGHFNNWMISDQNRMQFNKESGLWEGRALVKQGEYAYKYVRLMEGGIDDLGLDNSFVSSSREYTTFVYFEDPDLRFDRLLKVSHITTNR